ncbi:MAG: secretin N-terminal domain-containing protein [Myxococcota bacterium]
MSGVADEPWTVTVIRLKYAKAEQMAATLDRILPPGMTVVPDRPSNSLIIAGPSSPPALPIAPE